MKCHVLFERTPTRSCTFQWRTMNLTLEVKHINDSSSELVFFNPLRIWKSNRRNLKLFNLRKILFLRCLFRCMSGVVHFDHFSSLHCYKILSVGNKVDPGKQNHKPKECPKYIFLYYDKKWRLLRKHPVRPIST